MTGQQGSPITLERVRFINPASQEIKISIRTGICSRAKTTTNKTVITSGHWYYQAVGLEQSSLTKLDIGPIFRSFSLNIPDIRLK